MIQLRNANNFFIIKRKCIKVLKRNVYYYSSLIFNYKTHTLQKNKKILVIKIENI